MPWAGSWLTIGLLLGALALLSSPAAASSHEPIIVDAAGDAFETKPSDAAFTAQEACWSTGALSPEECRAIATPEDTPEAGSPAPPGLDIVAVRVVESAASIVLQIEVARLDAGLSDAVPREGTGAAWAVCWDGFAGCAAALTIRAEGRMEQHGYLQVSDERCLQCFWPIDVEYEPGAPGIVRLTVPRAALAHSDAGDELADFYADAISYDQTYNSVGWQVTTPARSPDGHLFQRSSLVDRAEGSRSFVFTLPSESTFAALSTPLRVDEDGDVFVTEPAADLVSIALADNATHVSIRREIAAVNISGANVEHWLAFGFSPGTTAIVATTLGGGAEASVVHACADRNCTYRLEVPARIEVTEGSPGWINLSIERAHLGYPPAGAFLMQAYAWTSPEQDQSLPALPRDPPVSGSVTVFRAYDVHFGSFYTLASDGPTAPDESAGGARIVVRDPGFDAASAPDRPEIDPNAGMYDLVLAAVEGTSPTSSRVTVGVRDLSHIAIPTGWKAIVYSVALETERGNYLVGFYRDAERGDFFCSTDTLVTTEDKSDPAATAWTLIDGVLSTSRAVAVGGGAGSAGPSTLTIFVPNSCFGSDTPGEIQASALVAAIHLVPETASTGLAVNEIWQADEARDDTITSFALGARVPTPAEPSWYARPFGIDNFWDITGIVFAILLALLGVIAVRRKRSALGRYLEEIAHASKLEPGPRGAKLVSIRDRLTSDLAAGRIVDTQYLVVERRLNEELGKARLADAGDLPRRLAARLGEMLADGKVTLEEARRFLPLLEDAGLTGAERETLARTVDEWVAQDASSR